MQLRQNISRDGRHPQFQLFIKASDEYLRERVGMSCSYFEVPAAGENLLESDLVTVGEVLRCRSIHEVIRRTFGVDGGVAPILRNGRR